ncbi:hypothetical protein ACH5RR_038996 [Cinchona calisaya]|uniref:Uncharacterized protein n=1 Tax=Cinchona calisaya TaxID=153742 RepID=A0ABD2XXG8_9GENT
MTFECYTKMPNDKGEKLNFVENNEAEALLTTVQINKEPEQDISTSQLQEKACEIYDPTREDVAVMKMSPNKLFLLKIETAQSCLMAKVKDTS